MTKLTTISIQPVGDVSPGHSAKLDAVSFCLSVPEGQLYGAMKARGLTEFLAASLPGYYRSISSSKHEHDTHGTRHFVIGDFSQSPGRIGHLASLHEKPPAPSDNPLYPSWLMAVHEAEYWGARQRILCKNLDVADVRQAVVAYCFAGLIGQGLLEPDAATTALTRDLAMGEHEAATLMQRACTYVAEKPILSNAALKSTIQQRIDKSRAAPRAEQVEKTCWRFNIGVQLSSAGPDKTTAVFKFNGLPPFLASKARESLEDAMGFRIGTNSSSLQLVHGLAQDDQILAGLKMRVAQMGPAQTRQ